MTKWTVIRVWREVEAPTAGDALLVPAPPGSHDSSNATRAEVGLAVLPFTGEELDALAQACGNSIYRFDELLEVAQSRVIRELASDQRVLLNSLRTACTEARWALMTPEERAEDVELRSQAEHLYEELKQQP